LRRITPGFGRVPNKGSLGLDYLAEDAFAAAIRIGRDRARGLLTGSAEHSPVSGRPDVLVIVRES
jgi:hypothetical protein